MGRRPCSASRPRPARSEADSGDPARPVRLREMTADPVGWARETASLGATSRSKSVADASTRLTDRRRSEQAALFRYALRAPRRL